MDRQQIGLKLTVDKLLDGFSIATFEDRLILQKAIYLAQAAGVNLGYYFRWYRRGPYCSPLTEDAFNISTEIGYIDESKEWKLDDELSSKLDEIKPLFSFESDKNDLPKKLKFAKKLELLASIQFLIDRDQVSQINAEQITAKLKEFGKRFSEQQVETALGDLRTYGILS